MQVLQLLFHWHRSKFMMTTIRSQRTNTRNLLHPSLAERANVVLGCSGSDDHGTVKAFAHALANALQSDKSSLALYPVEIKIGLTKNNHFQRILMASAYPVRWIPSLEMLSSNDDYHQKRLFLVITPYACNPSCFLSWKLDFQSLSASSLSYHCEIHDFSG